MQHVIVTANEMGGFITRSTNNPEYGYIRIEQELTGIDDNGWVKTKMLSTLLKGTMEDLQDLHYKAGQILPGKIIIRESTEPFNHKDPERDLKRAGPNGIVCMYEEHPIYRNTFYVTDPTLQDQLIPHTNQQEIREDMGQRKLAAFTAGLRIVEQEASL